MFDFINEEMFQGWHRWMASVLLILSLGLFQNFIYRVIDHWKIPSVEMRLRYRTLVRRVLFILLLFGLFLIWSSSIKGLATSLTVFAAAIVLATKELLQCVLGSVLKTSTQSFTLGNRIQVGNIRGIVINQSLLGTTLMEIGPGETIHQLSGKKVVIPNSQFLTTTVKNESLGGDFIFHSFFVGTKQNDPWEIVEKNILSACREVCQGFDKEAREAIANLVKEKVLYSPSPEPRVSIDLTDGDKPKFLVRITCREQEASRVEQEIVRIYLKKSAKS